MRQAFKQRQRVKRVIEEPAMPALTASLSDTTNAADLLAAINELLKEG